MVNVTLLYSDMSRGRYVTLVLIKQSHVAFPIQTAQKLKRNYHVPARAGMTIGHTTHVTGWVGTVRGTM